MERKNLRKAREDAGLNQRQLAVKLEVRQATISDWETGKDEPQPFHKEQIRAILKSTDPHLFDFDNQGSGEGLNLDALRRKTIETLLLTAGITFVPGTNLLSVPLLGPDQFLVQCSSAIAACWKFRRYGDLNAVEEILKANVPTLTQFANIPSEHQSLTAGLAVQAKILQIILATYKRDYAARERLCLEAVYFGRLSGNPCALATAMDWQGNTYIYCYRQPTRAIDIFNEALVDLGSEAQLNRSSIYSQLSIAHAQDKDKTKTRENETKARNYTEMARAMMPTYPELDPCYESIMFDSATLDQYEGRTYLYLAEHFPNEDYAQKAYDAFDLSLDKHTMGKGTPGRTAQILIRKADAAMALGDMDECMVCLDQGLVLAVKINNQKTISEVQGVMHRIPETWQKETAVTKLQKGLSHALMAVHR